MGHSTADQPISLAELDARHDALLQQLEELDLKVQAVLKEHMPQKASRTTETEDPLSAHVLMPTYDAAGASADYSLR